MSSPFSEEKSQAFLYAAKSTESNLALIKTLSLDPEVNLNWKCDSSWTTFHHACRWGHVDIVRYLLDFHDNQGGRTIDYNLVTTHDTTAFLLASEVGNEKVVEVLLADERIDVNKANEYGATPLWYASSWGHVGVVRMMLASAKQIDTLKRHKRSGETAAERARTIEPMTYNTFTWPRDTFQERKQKYLSIVSMIESYEEDPQAVRAKLRRELGIDEPWAGELFALTVFLSDGYLKIPDKY